MTAENLPPVKFALQFPQGVVIFMQGSPAALHGIGNIYFLPEGAKDAFMVEGQCQSFAGKYTVSVAKDKDAGAPAYHLVHEFADDGRLIDARAICGGKTLSGVLAGAARVREIAESLRMGQLRLHSVDDTRPLRVFNMARFADGRMLIQLFMRHELYIGTPGNFEKLDAKLVGASGNNRSYRLSAGGSVELPWGAVGPSLELPSFNGEKLQYMNFYIGENPAKFGLEVDMPKPLNPFSPELAKTACAAPAVAQTPRPSL